MIKHQPKRGFGDVRRCLRHKQTYTHGMDGATVAVRCEGLPDDVIERLQRKVMEQARELSALRKSEAAAQAELDRALLGSPGRARGPSPDRALRRRLADVEARLDAEKRAAADARARSATRAEAQLARKTPTDLRKKLADAEAALKSAAAGFGSLGTPTGPRACAQARRRREAGLPRPPRRARGPRTAGHRRRRGEGARCGRRGRLVGCGCGGGVRRARAEGDAALRDLRAAAEEAAAARSLAEPRTGPRCSARPIERRPPPPPLLRLTLTRRGSRWPRTRSTGPVSTHALARGSCAPRGWDRNTGRLRQGPRGRAACAPSARACARLGQERDAAARATIAATEAAEAARADAERRARRGRSSASGDGRRRPARGRGSRDA